MIRTTSRPPSPTTSEKTAWMAMLGAALAAALLLAACAGAKPAMSYERIDQRKQEIAMLWGQIREWRQNAGLRGVEPPAREILQMQGKPMSSATRVCPAPVAPRTEPCTDMCSLSDAICENAESICRIANELGQDPWARDKCSSSKASCKQAKKECCRCCSEEPPEPMPSQVPVEVPSQAPAQRPAETHEETSSQADDTADAPAAVPAGAPE